MCLLSSTNWVFLSQKTTFFIVTAVKTSNLTLIICSVLRIHSLYSVFYKVCSLNCCSPVNTVIVVRATMTLHFGPPREFLPYAPLLSRLSDGYVGCARPEHTVPHSLTIQAVKLNVVLLPKVQGLSDNFTLPQFSDVAENGGRVSDTRTNPSLNHSSAMKAIFIRYLSKEGLTMKSQHGTSHLHCL
jgi:hypothetical protein